jgi:hypothetical protein
LQQYTEPRTRSPSNQLGRSSRIAGFGHAAANEGSAGAGEEAVEEAGEDWALGVTGVHGWLDAVGVEGEGGGGEDGLGDVDPVKVAVGIAGVSAGGLAAADGAGWILEDLEGAVGGCFGVHVGSELGIGRAQITHFNKSRGVGCDCRGVCTVASTLAGDVFGRAQRESSFQG